MPGPPALVAGKSDQDHYCRCNDPAHKQRRSIAHLDWSIRAGDGNLRLQDEKGDHGENVDNNRHERPRRQRVLGAWNKDSPKASQD